MVWGGHSINDLLSCNRKVKGLQAKAETAFPDQGSGLTSSVGFTLLGSGCSVLALAVVPREFGEGSERPGRWMSSSSRISWLLGASGVVCDTWGLLSQRGFHPSHVHSHAPSPLPGAALKGHPFVWTELGPAPPSVVGYFPCFQWGPVSSE